jgi:hypothetical protein
MFVYIRVAYFLPFTPTIYTNTLGLVYIEGTKVKQLPTLYTPESPPPALTLASRPPTLSQLFPSHVPYPLHPLQVEFYWYHGSCARTRQVAPESLPPRLRSLHGLKLSLSCFYLMSHTPCTHCRLIFTDTMGGARERTGSPQIRPPCALARFTPSIEFGIVGNRQTSQLDSDT